MKRMLALGLALSLVFALAACKKSDDKAETTGTEVQTEIVTNAEGETVIIENTEAQTDVQGETVEAQSTENKTDAAESKPAASQSTAKPSSKPAEKPSANKPSNGVLDEAGLAALLNSETKKIAANGKYSAVRTSSFTKSIDVGSATGVIDSIIKGVSPEDDLNSVVGEFIGVGSSKGTMPSDRNSFKKEYQIKATALKASDIKITSASNGVYKFTIANATNPQRDNATAMGRFTNDFITASEVSAALKREIGSAIKLDSGDVHYKNLQAQVTVKNGKITAMQYSYTFDADLRLKAAIVPIHGTGAAKTSGSYTNIVY